jgi:peptidoglycan/LPS O-acetylase OafA/YrhL
MTADPHSTTVPDDPAARPDSAGPAQSDPPDSAAFSSREHIPGLDGIRGLAILLVLLVHFYNQAATPNNRIGHLLAGIFHSGWAGVDMFFVLSAFLITGILVDDKGSASAAKRFYLRRTLRIFPLYYGALILMLAIAPHVGLWRGEQSRLAETGTWWYWAYAVNFLVARSDWSAVAYDMGHFWSLAVEEQFYLIWPWIVWWLDRKSLKRCLIGLMVGGLLLRLVCARAGWAPDTIRVLLPTRCDTLAVGAWLALVFRTEGGIAAVRRFVRPVMLATGGILLIWFVKDRTLDATSWPIYTFGFTVMTVFSGALIAEVVCFRSWLGFFFNSRLMRSLGKYSYGIYVVHHLIRRPFAQWVAERGINLRTEGVAAWLAFIAAGCLLSYGIAFVVWHLYEKQFLKLRNIISDR